MTPARRQIALPGVDARVVASRKHLFVGELNPYGGALEFALYPHPPNCAGDRLCRLVLGISPEDYLSRYARANLCTGEWRIGPARATAHSLVFSADYETIVLLGAKVASAFGRGGRLFERDGRFVRLPHPSGRCRLWNEPGAFEKARNVLHWAGVLP